MRAFRGCTELLRSTWGLLQRKGSTWRVHITTACPGSWAGLWFLLFLKSHHIWGCCCKKPGELFPSPENRHCCNPSSQPGLLYELFTANATESCLNLIFLDQLSATYQSHQTPHKVTSSSPNTKTDATHPSAGLEESFKFCLLLPNLPWKAESSPVR